MKAHVSSILLGVRDLDAAKRFYTEGLGWSSKDDYGVVVFIESDGGSRVGFHGREGLAEQVGGNGPALRGVVAENASDQPFETIRREPCHHR
ncbi:VOC family protein [Nonomuraea sp. KM88]|uniref:VOC family protein n=1 Tax=Nonomuraea sp. KM88 TaxID=3457427 RepID=UPI003FCC6822